MTMTESILKQITLEPTMFFVTFGTTVERGAQITTNLLIEKICHGELDYSNDICANLTNTGFEDFNTEVQKKVNNFLMVSEWIGRTPALLYSFFAGSLLDQFGCKPFIMAPLIGWLITIICMFINCAFIDALPIEFFYADNILYLFGGTTVLYLGTYSYGSLNTKSNKRSSTLARYDGFETCGAIFGFALSPVILDNFGPLTNYGLNIGCFVIAILYTIIFIPHQPSATKKATKNLIKDLLISPVSNMIKCLFKRREGGIHWLIAIQIYLLSTYWFALYEIADMRYLYMLKTLDGFTGQDYSYYTTFNSCLSCVGLLVILPIMTNYFRLHDAMILAICVGLETLSLILLVFCDNLWQFYLASGVAILNYCKFGLVRSLLSKCIESHETGKIFSALAIFSAIVPLLANPIYRQVYNWTLPFFPGAVMILAAVVLGISTLLNLYLYSQRYRMNITDTDDTNSKHSENICTTSI